MIPKILILINLSIICTVSAYSESIESIEDEDLSSPEIPFEYEDEIPDKIQELREEICGKPKAPDYESKYYHPESKKCWALGDQGPCPQNMVIEDLDGVNATCDCSEPEETRGFIYHPETEKCYPALSKGPCPQGYMLTLTKDNKPTCDWDPCSQYQTKKVTHVLYNGRCYPLGSRCIWKDENGKNNKLWIKINGIEPECAFNGAQYGVATAIARKCKMGKKISVSGGCQTVFEF